jgi:hypothetical protein
MNPMGCRPIHVDARAGQRARWEKVVRPDARRTRMSYDANWGGMRSEQRVTRDERSRWQMVDWMRMARVGVPVVHLLD